MDSFYVKEFDKCNIKVLHFFMDEQSCLIYEGSCFRIEWFYDDNGKSQAYDYFLGTSDSQKRKFLMLVKRMGDSGKIFDKTKFNNELDQIYAFKPKPDRYLCFFFIGKKIMACYHEVTRHR